MQFITKYHNTFYTVTKIGNRAFEDCVALESIVIPSTVEEICGGAFNDCTYLREVVLNDGLKRIWSRSFQKCRSLQSIILPFTIEVVFKYTFWDCTSLREVVIHNERVQIDEKAFCDCKSLERFKFPGLLTRLDNIIHTGQRDIEAKIDDISAVEWRGGELIIPAVSREIEERWGMETLVEVDKEKLMKVEGLIRHYEMKEATTMFELALWKARIDQSDDAYDMNRDACRVEVPGPVKDAILQYL